VRSCPPVRCVTRWGNEQAGCYSLPRKNPYVTKWLAPERYNDYNKSGLVFEVLENAPPGHYDLKLEEK
jgi:hypothetical protein